MVEQTTTISTVDNDVQLHYGRLFMYQFLQRGFAKEPDQGFFSLIQNVLAGDEWAELVPDLAVVWAEITTANKAQLAALIEVESWEFRRLFVGPGALVAPPWESVYTSKEGNIFDRSTLEVRKIYAEQGYRFIRQQHEPDDHIALELEFMVKLIEKWIEQDEDKEKQSKLLIVQRDFVQHHLLNWLPQFVHRIEQGSNTQFYKGLAQLLHQFARIDDEWLQSVKED